MKVYTIGTASFLTFMILTHLNAAIAQPTRYYGDLLVGGYGPSGSGGAWDALDNLYDRYDWGWKGSFNSSEDFIGPYFGIRGGVLIWDHLDLSLSAGYSRGSVRILKGDSGTYYDPWYRSWRYRNEDRWSLEIVPLSASLGWSFVPWSIVRPYVGGGVDVYFWEFEGKVRSSGDFWKPYPYKERFHSDGVDVGGHGNVGLDISHPNWWASVITEFRYTWVSGGLDGNMARFLREDRLDLSGWSLLLGVRFRSPLFEPGRHYSGSNPAPRPGPAPAVDLSTFFLDL